MKVKVKYEASETQRNDTFDVEQDFGFTIEQWNKMSDEKKREILMEAVEHEPPYWSVDIFEEKN